MTNLSHDPEVVIRELLALLRPPEDASRVPAAPQAVRAGSATDLGAELGERLVSEIIAGARSGRQGIFVTEPERLRTAIFLRGLSLGEFAREAGIAPSTLSRALGGQPIAPRSWLAVMATLDQLGRAR